MLVSNSARDKRTVRVAIRITLLFYTEVARRLDRATCVNSPTFVYSKALFKSAFPDFSPNTSRLWPRPVYVPQPIRGAWPLPSWIYISNSFFVCRLSIVYTTCITRDTNSVCPPPSTLTVNYYVLVLKAISVSPGVYDCRLSVRKYRTVKIIALRSTRVTSSPSCLESLDKGVLVY